MEAGSTLRLAGNALDGGPAALTVATGFVNRGVIELTSEVGLNNATLSVMTGVLTNAPSGVIRSAVGAGGNRMLAADLDNRGRVEVVSDLSLVGLSTPSGAVVVRIANSGTIHVPEGQTLTAQRSTVWTHQGGVISGSGTLQFPPVSGSRLELEQDFVPGSYSMNAQGLTVEGPGRLMGPTDGEFRIHAWTVNAPMVVSGDLLVRGEVAIGGTFSGSSGNFVGGGQQPRKPGEALRGDFRRSPASRLALGKVRGPNRFAPVLAPLCCARRA